MDEPSRVVSHEELLQRGVPPVEASRITVRASLQQVVEDSFGCLGRIWLCALLILVVGMFAVLIWSQVVNAEHQKDECDQPLKFMLRLICAIVVVQGLQRDIIRNCLCYNMARDGPVEPTRVRAFRSLSLLAAVLWPLAASWMLLQTRSCNGELVRAVQVIVLYYAAVAVVVVIAPAFFLAAVLCLVRRGLLRLPGSPSAAPQGLIERLQEVPFDASRFADGAAPGSLPSACPVCLEAFSEQRAITGTPCGHVFHTDCLGGWLQVARSCPLCRLDLAEAAGPAAAAAQATASSGGGAAGVARGEV